MTTVRYPTVFLLQLPDFLAGVTPPCRNVDPEIFFPLPTQSADDAKAVCHTCPVEAECAQWAIVTGQDYGIYGGLSPEQRKARRRLGVTG